MTIDVTDDATAPLYQKRHWRRAKDTAHTKPYVGRSTADCRLDSHQPPTGCRAIIPTDARLPLICINLRAGQRTPHDLNLSLAGFNGPARASRAVVREARHRQL